MSCTTIVFWTREHRTIVLLDIITRYLCGSFVYFSQRIIIDRVCVCTPAHVHISEYLLMCVIVPPQSQLINNYMYVVYALAVVCHKQSCIILTSINTVHIYYVTIINHYLLRDYIPTLSTKKMNCVIILRTCCIEVYNLSHNNLKVT